MTFLFFPVAGPRYAFSLTSNAATQVWPARIAQRVLDAGDSWGAAFPSSHVAGAAVATLCALRFWRPLGWVLLPWMVGLVFAVVYGQFHYAIDAIAGLVVAVVVVTSLNAGVARARARTPAPSPSPSPAPEVQSPTLRL